MPSSQPWARNASDIPPTVPCPPSNPSSSRLPNAGGTLNAGASRNPASPSPTTYCPQTTIWASVSCGKTDEATFFAFCAPPPRNSVANMMLMRNPGMLRISPTAPSGSLSPNAEISASPSRPPTMDDGRYSRWRRGICTRRILPATRSTERMTNIVTAFIDW